ncbi:MAG: ribosome-associated translation inhibitor RaiA [Clostridia bacterium]|nr:ribosome-associated translation inhibitor RaiA [Clostridia bacterium]
MKTTIIGRQMNVYDETKSLIEKKLAKFDKYFKGEPEAVVTLRKVRESDRMEVTISCNGTLFRAEKTSPTFRIALDECIDSIERQLRKNKTRLQKKLREKIEYPAEDTSGDDYFGEENEFKIRTKSFPLKPMTAEEAILQMNLLDHTFYVYKDELTGETNVVYKREAGSYGLIVPEDAK